MHRVFRMSIRKNLSAGVLAAASVGGAILALNSAIAAPPRGQTSKPAQAFARHLDLRAPTRLFEGPDQLLAAAPSVAHRPAAGAAGAIQPPELGSLDFRDRPSIEDRVRRFHQEGLPVARLWDGRSMLLHLGLNSKGKPGLWIVKKLH
jgi:hypothetical protein